MGKRSVIMKKELIRNSRKGKQPSYALNLYSDCIEIRCDEIIYCSGIPGGFFQKKMNPNGTS